MVPGGVIYPVDTQIGTIGKIGNSKKGRWALSKSKKHQ
jgi:hypothetical protein